MLSAVVQLSFTVYPYKMVSFTSLALLSLLLRSSIMQNSLEIYSAQRMEQAQPEDSLIGRWRGQEESV